jgi:hypothetical protein
MRASSWPNRFWARFRGGLVQDVPPSLEACEWCRETDCTQERWLGCSSRLAGAAEQHPEGALVPCSCGTSDEIPDLLSEYLRGAGAVDGAVDGALDGAVDDEQDKSGETSGAVSSR